MSDSVCKPMDCSPPGSSVHGISQARMLEWVVISFSRGSSHLRDWIHISCISRLILYLGTTREAMPFFTVVISCKTDIFGVSSPSCFPAWEMWKLTKFIAPKLLFQVPHTPWSAPWSCGCGPVWYSWWSGVQKRGGAQEQMKESCLKEALPHSKDVWVYSATSHFSCTTPGSVDSV